MNFKQEQIDDILRILYKKSTSGVCKAVSISKKINAFNRLEIKGFLRNLYYLDAENPYKGELFFLGPLCKEKDLRATAFLFMLHFYDLILGE